ncbi:MAG: thioredoxin family protein [Actinomycetota bacterium]|nr:thioredoxin family protein [Actinomycetota bacterium]
MDSVTLLIFLFIVASIYGVWYQRSRGRIKATENRTQLITPMKIGAEFGERATLLQFSSAFCTPCRATKVLLGQVVQDFPGIKHVEIDAESNLELVRELNIKSTPTTLVLNSSGIEISRAVGAPRRSDVVASLNAIR